MRERLIELLSSPGQPWDYLLCKANIKSLADYLLVNGIIVPPCKVGDTVWCIIEGFNQVMEGRVRRFTVFDNFINVYCGINGYFEQVYMDKDFGKTAFRTREEAEAAVKGGEG